MSLAFFPIVALHRILVFLLCPEHRLRKPSGSWGSTTIDGPADGVVVGGADTSVGEWMQSGSGLSSILMTWLAKEDEAMFLTAQNWLCDGPK